MGTSLRVLCIFLCVCHALLISCSRVSLSFRVEPLSVVEKRGGVVNLSCSLSPSSSSSSAWLSWRFRGRPLDPATTANISVGPTSLTIPSLQPDQAGVYQCVAHSETSAIISRPARVTITGMAELGRFPRRSLAVVEGSTALIQCPLPHSHPPALPRLRIRGEWLEKSTGEYLILPSGNLQIVSVGPQHQGMYKCGAYNPVTRETRVEAHGTKLTVRSFDGPSPVRIVYPVTPQTVAVPLYEAAILECVLAGSPAPVAHWTKDGQEVVLGSNHRLLHNNLVLTAVRESDGGNYRCSTQSETSGLFHADYTVSVLVGASLSRGLMDQRASPGSSVLFTCAVQGNPTPNVTWLFNSAPVTPSPRLQISGSSLQIAMVTQQDEGMYQCLADNGIGSAQSAGALIIQSVPTVVMTVETPPPSVNPVQSDEGEGPFLEEEEENEEGLGFSQDTPIERKSDTPTPDAPIITSPPQTHKPDMYDLEWRAGRDWGSPIYAYFVKYRKLDDAGEVAGSWHTVRVPGSEKALRLSDLEPSSLYEVLMVARSAAGEGQPAMLTFRTAKEKSTSSGKNDSKAPFPFPPEKVPENENTNTRFGVVIPVPEAPDRPTISMATESSVYVTWIPRANGGSPITAFRVEYRRQTRNAEWLVAADNISPLKLSVEVRALDPGSAYRFRVVALNLYGESPHSTPSRPYTVLPASPPFASRPVAGPHITSTDAISDSQIMLRWTYTPSSNNNTPIQGFYIYYRPTDSDNDSDYKKDVVEGNKQWHLIGQLQPETSYDIKMQCFNAGGESEFSNVMICETKARLAPGAPREKPVTPPGPYPPEPPTQAGGLLYLIVGSVLGLMVLILLLFIAMCLWRNRQQSRLHKYDPPGYLYQPAEMNGHVLEYSTLPGTGRLSGYGHNGTHTPSSCPHLHHKLPNGLPLANGTGTTHYPSSHPHAHNHSHDEHSHPHHLHNGGGMYTALPQSESSDCINCQNFCNNNRCYAKANGTFPNGSLPMMHRVAPCQQDTLEMVPLSHVTSRCQGSEGQPLPGDEGGRETRTEEEEEPGEKTPPLSQQSCCQSRDYQCCSLEEREEELLFEEDSEGLGVCWESLGLPDLDCKEKGVWISGRSLTGDLIQPPLPEI